MAKSSNAGRILVTGATGAHGSTGAQVVRSLLEHGRAVRVLARRNSERTQMLEQAGAEIVIGDLHDRQSLVSALEGVDQASFTYPIAHGIIEAAVNFAAAAREVQPSLRIVVTSMAVAHPTGPSKLGRAQWLAEEAFSWAGLNICVLRIAALFFENIALLHAATIREEGVIRNSFGNAKVPWISGRDSGLLVSKALLEPDELGRGVHYPVGAQLLDHTEIAEAISDHLGKRITYSAISAEEWTAELQARATQEPNGLVTPHMAQHIASVGSALASGKGPIRMPDREQLGRLIGVKPLEFSCYLAEEPAFFFG